MSNQQVDLWNGIYEIQKKVHFGSLKMDVKAGQLIIVRGDQMEINFGEYPNPGFDKLIRGGLALEVDKTEQEVREIWKKEIQTSENQEKPKVPRATWRG